MVFSRHQAGSVVWSFLVVVVWLETWVETVVLPEYLVLCDRCWGPVEAVVADGTAAAVTDALLAAAEVADGTVVDVAAGTAVD